MRKWILSPPLLPVPDISPSPGNSVFRIVSWEMETLNPWGWGGPRAHCSTSWESAFILGLLQERERKALALLSPPPPAAFKGRKQLWLHSWRVWSCKQARGRCVPRIPSGLGPSGYCCAPLPCCAGLQWGCQGWARRHTMSWGSSRSRQQKEGLEGCGGFFAVVVVCLFFFFFFFNVVFPPFLLSALPCKDWNSSRIAAPVRSWDLLLERRSLLGKVFSHLKAESQNTLPCSQSYKEKLQKCLNVGP